MTKPPETDVKAVGELFNLTIRGQLASMFMTKHTEPSVEQWEILLGDRDVTIRELGDIAFELGFNMELRLLDSTE